MNKNKNSVPESDLENTEIDEVENLESDKVEADEIEAVEIGMEEPEVDVELLQAENQKLREDYLRAFADAENTKRRCAQEIEKNQKYAISSFSKNLLSIADNLHRALEAAAKDSGHSAENCEALLKGVELTEAELMRVFNKFGITKIEILGQVFDPNFHQVIQEVEDTEKPAGTVIAELQTGYMLNDRLLREAMVVVTKGGPTA